MTRSPSSQPSGPRPTCRNPCPGGLCGSATSSLSTMAICGAPSRHDDGQVRDDDRRCRVDQHEMDGRVEAGSRMPSGLGTSTSTSMVRDRHRAGGVAHDLARRRCDRGTRAPRHRRQAVLDHWHPLRHGHVDPHRVHAIDAVEPRLGVATAEIDQRPVVALARLRAPTMPIERRVDLLEGDGGADPPTSAWRWRRRPNAPSWAARLLSTSCCDWWRWSSPAEIAVVGDAGDLDIGLGLQHQGLSLAATGLQLGRLDLGQQLPAFDAPRYRPSTCLT